MSAGTRRGWTFIFALALAVLLAAGARADDEALLEALAENVPAAVAAAAGAVGSTPDPDAVQRSYDAARDLEEALVAAEPVSEDCRRALGAALALARGEIAVAEGFDRLDPPARSNGEWAARTAASALRAARPGCHRRRALPARAELPELESARSGGALFGDIAESLRPWATNAQLLVDGRSLSVRVADAGMVRFNVAVAPGRHTLEVRFRNGGLTVARARSEGVWVLPPSA